MSVIFLISLFILYLSIHFAFPQNDDWVYRLNVEQFLNGDFTLHWYLGPTFYTQGFIAAIFKPVLSLFFGEAAFSVLTALFGIANLFLFRYLLKLKFNLDKFTESVILILFAFNPYFIYLTMGFMTGQYFLFFFFLCLILYERNEKLWYQILVSFIALNVRQVALFIPLSFGLFDLTRQKYKSAFVNLLWFAGLFLFLEYLFPKTIRMKEVPLQLQHLLKFDYTFALIWGVAILLTAFLLPLIMEYLISSIAKTDFKIVALFAVSSVLIYFLAQANFKPMTISWGEFPYFENTFERTGFYPRGVHGTKYYLRGGYDLYKYWNSTSVVVLVLAIPFFIRDFLRRQTVYHTLFITYAGMLVVTETFYDRYLLPLVPISIIILLQHFYGKTFSFHLEKLILKIFYVGFSLFLIFFSYQLSMDFLKVNNYVWSRSEKLVREGIAPQKIHGTNAWKLKYRNSTRLYSYFFSYDSPTVNPEITQTYNLIETHDINYPLNIFVNPKVYLYKWK